MCFVFFSLETNVGIKLGNTYNSLDFSNFEYVSCIHRTLDFISSTEKGEEKGILKVSESQSSLGILDKHLYKVRFARNFSVLVLVSWIVQHFHPYSFFLVHCWLKKALQIKCPDRLRNRTLSTTTWGMGREYVKKRFWENLNWSWALGLGLLSLRQGIYCLHSYVCWDLHVRLWWACVCFTWASVCRDQSCICAHVVYDLCVFSVCVYIYGIGTYLYMSVCTFLWRLWCVCRGWAVHIDVYVHEYVCVQYIQCGYGWACVHMYVLYVGVVGWMFTGVCLRVVCVCARTHVPYTWCTCGGQKTASVLLRGFHGWN